MKTHRVVHYTAIPDGADLGAALIDYLNRRKMRARLNEENQVAMVWELAELDQLDAFLRDLFQKARIEPEAPKIPRCPLLDVSILSMPKRPTSPPQKTTWMAGFVFLAAVFTSAFWFLHQSEVKLGERTRREAEISLPLPLDPAAAIAPIDVIPTPVVREPIPAVDTSSFTTRISELEAEVARLKGQLLAAKLIPISRWPESYLTENDEIRNLFIAQCRPDVMDEVMREEAKLRADLAAERSKHDPANLLASAWPYKRDELLRAFVQRLVDAGLSMRAIELYRASLADYL